MILFASTVTIEAWILPLLITLATIVWTFFNNRNDSYGLGMLFKAVIGIIISLISWLIYFMVMYFVK